MQERKRKSQICTQNTLPVPAECFASQTLNSADRAIDLVHSFINAGCESLCLQVSFIKPLEMVIKLLTLNVWVYTLVRDSISLKVKTQYPQIVAGFSAFCYLALLYLHARLSPHHCFQCFKARNSARVSL